MRQSGKESWDNSLDGHGYLGQKRCSFIEFHCLCRYQKCTLYSLIYLCWHNISGDSRNKTTREDGGEGETHRVQCPKGIKLWKKNERSDLEWNDNTEINVFFAQSFHPTCWCTNTLQFYSYTRLYSDHGYKKQIEVLFVVHNDSFTTSISTVIMV